MRSAISSSSAAVIIQDRLVPALVGPGARLCQRVVDSNRLYRIALGELPAQIRSGHELPKPRVKRRNVVVLEIHLDEGLPVVGALLDLDPVEHVAGEVEIRGDTDAGQITRDIARTVEQQAVPALQRRARQLGARLLVEVRRTEERALEVVGP